MENKENKLDDQNQEQETITMTEEEINKRIESESDKRVAKIIEKKVAELEANAEKKAEELAKEKARLSQLSENERKEEEFKQREEALKQREEALKFEQLNNEVVHELTKKGINAGFAKLLKFSNDEEAHEAIKQLDELMQLHTEQVTQELTKQSTPKSASTVFGNNKPAQTLGDQLRANRLIK